MLSADEKREELIKFLDMYELTENEKKELCNIVLPIYSHDEFQRRLTNEFPHHGKITLGTHILQDTIKTYLLSKQYLKIHDDKNFDIVIAIRIAMLHDLYTLPWQNNKLTKVKKISNKHGFRHPIEAVINASSWYPDLFKDSIEAEKIIDGIVHHMYPLPVDSFTNDKENNLELKNFELVHKLPSKVKEILIESSNRSKIGSLSICQSKYVEGRIMSKADRYVSMRQIKDVSSATALLTGHNRRLKRK